MGENKNTPQSTKPHRKSRTWVTAGAVIVGILWLASWLLLLIDSPEDRGALGDMFGSVNALFSGLAFVGIIFTILLQQEELSLQRDELILTRQELQRTAEAQEKSEVALNRQAENLKISAMLSALNTLYNYYAEEEENSYSEMPSNSTTHFRNKKLDCIRQIEEILENKVQH